MLLLYLRSRMRLLAAWGIVIFLFALVLFLCRAPLAPVLYAALLSGFFLLLFGIFDYLSFRTRHRRLSAGLAEPLLAADALPPAATAVEADYQQLLRALQKRCRAQEQEAAQRQREMTEYYTTWVHQIKTPIAAMDLLLQERQDAAPLRCELQKIEEYTEMALCYQRLHTDSTDFVIRTCRLDDIVRQTVRRYAPSFIQKKLQLHYTPPDCSVLTDEKWLAFVIGQVLSNALKYTAQGGVSIFSEAPKTLCIRDTGIGIDPADLPRVFEMGYTGGNGRLDKRASGIGLGLCRQIMTKLGHRITIASEAGRGTTVRLFLATAQLEVE